MTTHQPDRRVVALQKWDQAENFPIRLGTDLAALLAAADAVDPLRARKLERVCSICGRQVAVNQDGRFRRHGINLGRGLSMDRCPGGLL